MARGSGHEAEGLVTTEPRRFGFGGETWSVSCGHARDSDAAGGVWRYASDSDAARADMPDACAHASADVHTLAARTHTITCIHTYT